MEQRISVLTIGADDLNAMKKFYGQVLGWTTVAENKDIAFYKLNGFLLSICDRKMLFDFVGVDHKEQGFRSVTIGHNVDTKEEVQRTLRTTKGQSENLERADRTTIWRTFLLFFRH
jgi:uncharacterized protein